LARKKVLEAEISSPDEIRLKTVKRAQLNPRHRFWSNIVQISRNISKLAEFHPNRRRKNQPWVEFRPTWTIFDKIGIWNIFATKIQQKLHLPAL
jgi:hypothetical protein